MKSRRVVLEHIARLPPTPAFRSQESVTSAQVLPPSAAHLAPESKQNGRPKTRRRRRARRQALGGEQREDGLERLQVPKGKKKKPESREELGKLQLQEARFPG